MIRAKLTKRTIDQAAAHGEEYTVWDVELRGFGCRVLSSGRKTYFLYYRTRGGRQRRPTIGTHGALTCDQARDIARQWLAEVARGGDPSGARQTQRKAATVKQLGERYLAEYAEVHKKPSSVKQDRRMIERQIDPRIGGLSVNAINRPDVVKLQHALRTTPYECNRCLALLSKMFNLAELWGLRSDGSNPCRHVTRFPEEKRTRFFSTDELARLGKVLDQFEHEDANRGSCVRAIRLLALTGCRVGEIIALRWSLVNFMACTLDLPDSKTGAKRVPLGEPALNLLKAIPKGVSDWVFPTTDLTTHLSTSALENAWKVVRDAADLSDGRLHDFRHTVGTYSGHAGHNAFIVRDLLGHKTLAMTDRYVSKDFQPLRVAATAVSRQIADALEGRRRSTRSTASASTLGIGRGRIARPS